MTKSFCIFLMYYEFQMPSFIDHDSSFRAVMQRAHSLVNLYIEQRVKRICRFSTRDRGYTPVLNHGKTVSNLQENIKFFMLVMPKIAWPSTDKQSLTHQRGLKAPAVVSCRKLASPASQCFLVTSVGRSYGPRRAPRNGRRLF